MGSLSWNFHLPAMIVLNQLPFLGLGIPQNEQHTARFRTVICIFVHSRFSSADIARVPLLFFQQTTHCDFLSDICAKQNNRIANFCLSLADIARAPHSYWQTTRCNYCSDIYIEQINRVYNFSFSSVDITRVSLSS